MSYFKNPIFGINLISSKKNINEFKQMSVVEFFQQLNERDNCRIISGYKGDPQWLSQESRMNEKRNRYSNVFPWDRTRIKLPIKSNSKSKSNGNGNNLDYINASKISINDCEYIATQGPLPNTIHHFWSMCFHQSNLQNTDIIIVVMVTPLKESGMLKCEKYWPDTNCDEDFTDLINQDDIDLSDLKISHQSQNYYSDGNYQLSTFKLSSGDKIKTVYHFYYDKWADCKAPTNINDLIIILNHLNQIKKSTDNEPIPIIHCSAGVGRTGTFIAIDQLVNQNGDFIKIVDQMRNDRMMMVQTIHQLNYIKQVQLHLQSEGRNDKS